MILKNLTNLTAFTRSVLLNMAKKRASTASPSVPSKKPKDSPQKDSPEKVASEKAGGDAPKTKTVRLHTAGGAASNLKITSWNVNGVRANIKKNGFDWLLEDDADVICLQETKCATKDLPAEIKKQGKYRWYWNEAKNKKGYSGVAVLCKEEPISCNEGIGKKEHGEEGRTLTLEFDKYYLVNSYVPNSQRGLARLDYRQQWDRDMLEYIQGLDGKKPVVLCGDLNVSHLEIDLANPKSNRKNAGFTQQERDGMTAMLEKGFVDSFRHLYPEETGAYTWWSNMRNSRARNIGWRLDYFIVSGKMKEGICDSVIREEVMGSDHCPITLYASL